MVGCFENGDDPWVCNSLVAISFSFEALLH